MADRIRIIPRAFQTAAATKFASLTAAQAFRDLDQVEASWRSPERRAPVGSLDNHSLTILTHSF
jgi:hypothetical protein